MLFVRSSHSLDNNQVEDGIYAQLAATDNSNKRIPFCFKIPAIWQIYFIETLALKHSNYKVK